MDPHKNSEPSFIGQIVRQLINVGLLVGGVYAVLTWGPVWLNRPDTVQVMNRYNWAVSSVQSKVEKLRRSQEENNRLHLENTQLKQKIDLKKFDCALKTVAETTLNYELKLNKETGSKIGRIIQGMNYRIPDRLSPIQIYSLGISYLKAHDDEKVAIIFSSLTGLEETDTYRTAQNYLVAGMAWYRIENMLLAEYFLDQALKLPETASNLQPQAQARLWKSLVARRQRDEPKAQAWLKELVDHSPHSPEASWINTAKVEHDEDSED